MSGCRNYRIRETNDARLLLSVCVVVVVVVVVVIVVVVDVLI